MKDKIIKKTYNFLDLLKYLTKWTTNQNLEYEKLEKVISLYDISDTFLISRLISYGYSNPHFIWYINKYMNALHKYSKLSKEILYTTIRSLIKLTNPNNNKLYFIKSNENKDTDRITLNKLFYDYYKNYHNIKLNHNELQCLYNLVRFGKIKEDDIKKINNILNGDDNIKLTQLSIDNDKINNNMRELIEKDFEQARIRKLPTKIVEFVNNIKTNKTNRTECKSCKLYDKKMVVLDTNMDDFGPIDVMFIALNPGKDDPIFDKPLIGKSGKYHREKMFYMPKDTKWLITNILLCSTANQAEIGKKDDDIIKEATKCWGNVEQILQKFPSRYYVLLGVPAMKMFGIKGSIIKNSGELIDVNGAKFIVLPHPSSVITYHGDNEDAYKASFNLIYKLLEKKETLQELKKETSQIEQQISNNTEIDFSKVTFFDAININNKKIKLIFIDENGKKIYVEKDFKFPLFIKEEDWNNCELIESDFTYVSYIDGFDKSKLSSMLNHIQELEKKNCVIGENNDNINQDRRI